MKRRSFLKGIGIYAGALVVNPALANIEVETRIPTLKINTEPDSLIVIVIDDVVVCDSKTDSEGNFSAYIDEHIGKSCSVRILKLEYVFATMVFDLQEETVLTLPLITDYNFY